MTRPSAPVTERLRHELKRRALTVRQVDRLTPHMLRITLHGASMADFRSDGPDDHVKLMFPDAQGQMVMRDYTPRQFGPDHLVIDFALHQAGPATAWALAARPGDTLTVGGPRGSRVVRGVANWMLIGDETALPAMGRMVEGMAAGERVTTIAAVPDAADQQTFATAAQHRAVWLHRPQADAAKADVFLAVLADVALSPDLYIWIAAEAGVARSLRQHLLDRGHALHWMRAAGYWTQGVADGSVKFEDAA